MIITRKISKEYPGGMRAVSGINLAIRDGDFAFVVGPNGAGKTTLFKLIRGDEVASEGCVTVDGRDVSELRSRHLARHRRLVATVFQDVRLIPTKNVFENVALPLQTDRLDASTVRERTDASLFLSGLEPLASRFPSELSGGQRQQVAIARALVNRPSVILADEPTGNLSPAATALIMHLLTVCNECGITVLVATHDFDIVDTMQRRVIALSGGRIIDDRRDTGYPAFWKNQTDA